MQFLEDLDQAYMRNETAQRNDYCLACHIPGGSTIPMRRNGFWLSAPDFHPTNKLQQLLEKHQIPFKEFIEKWVKIRGETNDSFSTVEMCLDSWDRGHMPSSCPSRRLIIQILEALDS
ncbi:hypothetical protein HN958_03205 [Candidatus Falkowbacteria bacterium]|nr:hypothetical protein [Candidatus Falkowbacteria bacterium]